MLGGKIGRPFRKNNFDILAGSIQIPLAVYVDMRV